MAVVAAVSLSALAQERSRGAKKDGDRPRMSFKDMAGEDGKLTKDEFVAARMKNMPDDRKEKAKEMVGKMWDRLAGDKKELTEEEFKAAIEKMMKERKDQGGGKRGERKK